MMSKRLTPFQDGIEPLKLRDSERAVNLRNPIVVPDLGMRKPGAGRSNSLITQGPNPSRDLHIVGDYCTAFTGGDLLIRIKSKGGDIPERTDFPATIFCSDRFARIFNDREPVPLRHFKKAIHLSRNAESVNEE